MPTPVTETRSTRRASTACRSPARDSRRARRPSRGAGRPPPVTTRPHVRVAACGRPVRRYGCRGVKTLLVRDLAQVASPAGRGAPLRGPGLASLDVIEDAYVVCRDGRVTDVGAMAELRPLPDADVVELDGRDRCAIPGLVDCHTHLCFAGDRVDEFDLRAGGATYEELHAAGGGILSTVRATRAAGEDGLLAATERHRNRMLAHGTTTFEGKSGYGLDHETEVAQLRAVASAGGVPTWLGAHAIPPEFEDAAAYLDFALAAVLPEAA